MQRALRPVLLCVMAAIAAGSGGPAAATVLNVGVGQAYATLGAAVAAATAGDTVDVHAGTYADQSAIINVPLTIEGVGGTPVFTATMPLSNGKAFLVTNASVTVDNIRFQDALDGDGNGAGIRYQAGDLVVSNDQFVGNQEGILATPGVAGTGTVLVTHSMFRDNGVASGSFAGSAHGIYATQLASLTVRNSVFSGTQVGHDIKSRAAQTLIVGNTLDDGVTGTTSYAIDISNGGEATIVGNAITQGPDTQNETMISYDAEGLRYVSNSLLVDGNSLGNTLPGISIGVYNHDSGLTADITCNAFNGLSNPVVGPALLQGNVVNGPLPACAVPEPSSIVPVLASMAALCVLSRRRSALRPVTASPAKRSRPFD